MLLRGLLLLSLLVLTGCPAKTSGSCKKDKDCSSGVCVFGKCQACAVDNDCQDGQSCISNECVESNMAEGGSHRYSGNCDQTGTIYFGFNVYDLSSESVDGLAQMASCMRENSNGRFLVAGNTDERGTVEYNLALGEKRAKAVTRYLQNSGIDGSRLDTISYGKERPVNNEHNQEAWAQNRRADITLER